MAALTVVTASGGIEISRATKEQLVKRLGGLSRGHAARKVLTEADASRPVKLDDDGMRQVFAELSYWLDHPGPDGFPDDARALYRALAGELEPAASAGG